MKKEALILENRRLIYDFILNNPGLHLRNISRDLGMKMGTLRHHVDRLEKQGILSSRREGNLKIYFIAGKLGPRDKNISPLLQQKRFRDIILNTIIHPGLTHKEIAKKLSLKPPTLSKYVKILEQRNIIYHERFEKERRYYITDEEGTMRLLLTYRRSFWDSFVDAVLEMYFER